MEFLLAPESKSLPVETLAYVQSESGKQIQNSQALDTNNKLRILSFDCANKSLAYFSAEFDPLYIAKYKQLRNNVLRENAPIEATAKLLLFLSSQFAENIKCGVVDVLDGKKVADTELIHRTKCLKKKLDEIVSIMPAPDLVLIEAQPPNKNHKSSIVQDQLCMYFIDRNIECVLMDPRVKNKYSFDSSLHHDVFICKNPTLYAANKNHSKHNFLKFIKVFNMEYVLDGVKKENIDDLADSFMQIFAYLAATNYENHQQTC